MISKPVCPQGIHGLDGAGSDGPAPLHADPTRPVPPGAVLVDLGLPEV